ncbi:hypothetical protein OG218_19840 [Kineococcus sp. NBC_00420]|uniref:hypothetical protein n=1 Tax=Kineococcus sp. NBC_00420 TaxID=2903564 RepID=UPI002E249615
MDENTKPRHWGRLLTAGVAGAAALGLVSAGSAAADTSVATANAVTVGVLGVSAVTSNTVSASNPGSGATQTTAQTPALSLLGGQGGITAGTLVQTAVARADGSSAACAGLVGAGGVITVGADGTCAVTGGGSSGVQITLVAGTVIKADAILASCTAASAGTTTNTVKLTNAKVFVAGIPTIVLNSSPAENSGVVVPGAAQLGLRATSTPAGPGSVQATALTINLLSGTVAAVNVGTVTCGANAKTVPTNALPGPAAPLSAAALAVLGWRFRRPVLHALSARSGSRG